ncbi:hypothetical protein [Rheinheimera aquimaris]|uniref:hypothetical protein n=1 Tax=Rheinheimera aquimaris TaxID=412437 RepID=UPI001066C0BD|nr:hypothetical protein [Rheinheimera aquimaris]|tara:strand:+ start:1194 stop:1622 length:429 start_codon:yes stop_codon:yes gene_type:complete
MILSMPFQRNEKVNFDPVSGYKSAAAADEVSSGNFHNIEGHSVALYAQDGQLKLQIDKKVWLFSSSTLNIDYHHKFQQRLTHFSITSPDDNFAIDYRAWWADIPDFEPLEPEMDQDEDYLAYIYEVWKTPSIQQALLERWTA